MKNYVFKSEDDFKSKQEDILILRKKVKDRLIYIAQKAAQILNSEILELNYKDKEVFIQTDNIFDISEFEEEPNDMIKYHMDIHIPKNTLFKDKFNNEMDIRYQVPRRWLNEDFEEELKNGLYIKKDEEFEKLVKEEELTKDLVNSLNLTKDQENILGITEKLKQLSDAVEYYNY